MIGCKGDRAWVRDANIGRWRDSFFLTGMTLGEAATVWRLSFDGEANTIDASDAGVVVSDVKVELPKQGVAPCDLHFPRAWIGHVADTKATAGVWIVQNRTDGAEEGQLCHVRCGQLGTFPWPSQRVKTDDTSLKSDDGAATSCCDAHPELCQSMDPQPPARTEVVAFHAPGMYGATPDSWKLYDFSKITAIGNFYQLDPEMLCLAHSKQVRILDWYLCNGPNGDPNFIPHQLNPYNEPGMLLNSTLIELYVAFSTKCVKSHGLDGMVLDIVSRKIARP